MLELKEVVKQFEISTDTVTLGEGIKTPELSSLKKLGEELPVPVVTNVSSDASSFRCVISKHDESKDSDE